jgi:hypothetical protein
MQLILPDKVYDLLADNILSLEFINDYEKNMFAIFKVVLKLSIDKKLNVLRHKREIKVFVELEKVGYDVEIEQAVTNPENVFRLLFVPYFNDDEENVDADGIEARTLQNYSQSEIMDHNAENYFETQNVIDLYLFNQDLLKGSRYSYNKVNTSGTLQNVVARMLTESKHPKVLMSRFDNYEVYNELLVPVNPVYKNLMYLDQYYGFYKSGTLVWYDIDCLYIINANGKVTARRQNEWDETVIIVAKLPESIPGQGMLRVPGERTYYCVISEIEINPRKGSILQNASLGQNLKMVYTDGVKIDNIKTGADNIGGPNTTVSMLKKDSKYTGEIMAARIKENDVIMYISATNLDMSAFTPNKRFSIIFDDTSKYAKYKGDYRLAYASHLIKIESENFSSARQHIVLKKIR